MAIHEVFVINRYSRDVSAMGYGDHEEERKSVNEQHDRALGTVNELLNDGFTCIDIYTWMGYRVYVLHKPDQGDAPAHRNPMDSFGIKVPDSDKAI